MSMTSRADPHGADFVCVHNIAMRSGPLLAILLNAVALSALLITHAVWKCGDTFDAAARPSDNGATTDAPSEAMLNIGVGREYAAARAAMEASESSQPSS